MYTPNLDRLSNKLRTIVSKGKNQLKIVTDFDATLSKPTSWSSWCVFEKRDDLSEEYRSAIARLVKLYYPREIDPNLTLAERVGSMVEWRTAAVKLLANEQITESLYQTILEEVQDYIQLRPGTVELLQFSHDNNVPVLIFSAGIFDVVDALIKYNLPSIYETKNPFNPTFTPPTTPIADIEGVETGTTTMTTTNTTSTTLDDTNTIRIIANHCVINETHNRRADECPASPTTIRAIVGLNTTTLPSIHVYNKHEQVIHQEPYFTKQIAPRSTALVMGDSLGDTTMVANDLADPNIIRIAFLNLSKSKTKESHLQKYLDVFDVVFVDNDDGIKWAHDIIDATIKHDISPNEKVMEESLRELLQHVQVSQ